MKLIPRIEKKLQELKPGVRFTYRPDLDELDETRITFSIPYEQITQAVLDLRHHDEIKDILAAEDNFYFLHIVDEPPKLVDADVGSIVEFYRNSDYYGSQPSLGLVTSRIPNAEGTAYGCRHFLFQMADHCFSPVLKLSPENYGGYYKGFLRVVEKDEAKKVLLESLEAVYKRALGNLEASMKSGHNEIEKFFEVLAAGWRSNVETLRFNDVALRGIPEEMNVERYRTH